MAWDPTDAISALTRNVLDTSVHRDMLSESNTALRLMMQNPIEQVSGGVQANIIIDEDPTTIRSTGGATVTGTVKRKMASVREPFVRFEKQVFIDGFNYQLISGGRQLSSDMSPSAFGNGGMHQLVNYHKEIVMNEINQVLRSMNDSIIKGGDIDAADQGPQALVPSGDANKSKRFVGLMDLAADGASYGGQAAGAQYGAHNFDGLTAVSYTHPSPRDS